MQIVVVKDITQGVERVKEFLYEEVDRRTVLFLSGGNTPKPLYEVLAKEEILKPAALAMVDERYGEGVHEKSNEKMIRATGLVAAVERYGAPFYPILRKGLSIEETAKEYDKVARDIFFNFPKSVAIMGVGTDGHTAGILPETRNMKSEIRNTSNNHEFVTSYTSEKMEPPQRITLTFAGLALIDFFIVFIFGKDKKKVLPQMLEGGSVEEMPARFFNQVSSKKSIIITDQTI